MDTLGIPEDLPAVIFVNGGSAKRNTVLKAEDVLVVMSPVQGG
jgi:sulfur carrier protein ThiS